MNPVSPRARRLLSGILPVALICGFGSSQLGACGSPSDRPNADSGNSGFPSSDEDSDSGDEDNGDDSVTDDNGDDDDASEDADKDDDDKDDDASEDNDAGDEDEGEDSGDDDSENSGHKFDLDTLPDFEPEARPCAIDFLFVIDNSGSMEDEQQNLADSVPEFIKTVQSEIENLDDYHIGVVVTDDSFANVDGCNELGGLVVQTQGQNSSNQNCGPYANGLNFMTPEDDLTEAFTCAAKPGTGGRPNEVPIDAMLEALSDPLGQPGRCNEGFLRDEALLVTIIITDEEDDHEFGLEDFGSAGDPPDWHERLLKIKGGDPRRIVVLGLIGTEAPNECDPLVEPDQQVPDTGAQISRRLISFIEMMGDRGFVGDVCAENYDPFFEDAISVIDLACQDLPQG